VAQLEHRSREAADALARLDYHVDVYVAKTHFGKPEQRDLILSYGDVYVVNIKRDMRDVVVRLLSRMP
jgi:hypothetical protein